MKLNLKRSNRLIKIIFENAKNSNKKILDFYDFLEYFGYEVHDSMITGIFDKKYDGNFYGPVFLAIIYLNNKIEVLNNPYPLVSHRLFDTENILARKFIYEELGTIEHEGLLAYPIELHKEFLSFLMTLEDEKEFDNLTLNFHENIEIKIDFSLRLSNINNQNKYSKASSQILNNFCIYSLIRRFFLMKDFKEICTHPILNSEKIIEPKRSNIVGKFLSHDYLRESIIQSFYQEYEVFKANDKIFEISDIFEVENNIIVDKKSIFLAISTKIFLSYKNILSELLTSINIIPRISIIDGEIYYFKSDNKILIGHQIVFNNYNVFEIKVECIKDLNIKKDYKYFDININSEDSEDLVKAKIFSKYDFIMSMNLIDKFKNKYTFRIKVLTINKQLVEDIKLDIN